MSDYDVLVVGGSAAGLSGALMLGRSRRKVLVCDSADPRNKPSPAVHAFFSRDGIAPADLMAIGREQLQPYDVTLRTTVVQSITPGDVFTARLEDGSTVTARKILLATGVCDELPDIAGIHDYWGASIYHCPYCHGWEARDQPLALIASGSSSVEFILMLTQWSADLVLCTNGPAGITDAERETLQRFNIPLYEQPIHHLAGENGQLAAIVFEDGTQLARSGAFVQPQTRLHGSLAQDLGCALTEQGLVQVDAFGLTSVPGVYAAGDMTRPAQVLFAAAGGALAGVMINKTLISEDHARIVA
ncbi:MAG: FAD-dependent pyridine nucleotide-disulfide oxidoreductase [Anaerolineaceae bacterium]|nr:FAD-dependent pyridine nucleotide-disulfide oxidoreductase [Anaerolineaceae bacterium]